MLSNIKNKFSTLLESLLDGNDEAIMRRMIKILPSNLILNNLAWILEKYLILYGD